MSFLNNLGFDDTPKRARQVVHIRIQQRTKTKALTIIEGLGTDLDLQKIARAMRLKFNVSGAVISRPDAKEQDEVPEFGTERDDWLLRNNPNDYIQLTGDQRETVKEFLLTHGICDKDDLIQMHGA